MSSRCHDAPARLACALAFALGVACAATSGAQTLRVCADPADLPYSNRAGEGFENRIASLLARDLHATLAYYWLPQWRGYARKTLERGRCDLIPGIARDDESVLASDAYYRGMYALVYAPSRFPGLTSLDDPRLRSIRIGLQVIGIDATPSPPARALARRGIVDNVVGYPVMGEAPSALRIVDALANGALDVGIVWSPQPGYFIARRHLPLAVVPIERDAADPSFDFAIAMGVRRDDPALQRAVNASLARLKPQIDAVLREYAVTRVDEHAARAAR